MSQDLSSFWQYNQGHYHPWTDSNVNTIDQQNSIPAPVSLFDYNYPTPLITSGNVSNSRQFHHPQGVQTISSAAHTIPAEESYTTKMFGVPYCSQYPRFEQGAESNQEYANRVAENNTSFATVRADSAADPQKPFQVKAFERTAKSGKKTWVHEAGEFKCQSEGCSEVFEKAAVLREHIYKEHSPFVMFQCRDCGKTYTMDCTFKRHKKAPKATRGKSPAPKGHDKCKPRKLTEFEQHCCNLRQQIQTSFERMDDLGRVKDGLLLIKEASQIIPHDNKKKKGQRQAFCGRKSLGSPQLPRTVRSPSQTDSFSQRSSSPSDDWNLNYGFQYSHMDTSAPIVRLAPSPPVVTMETSTSTQSSSLGITELPPYTWPGGTMNLARPQYQRQQRQEPAFGRPVQNHYATPPEQIHPPTYGSMPSHNSPLTDTTTSPGIALRAICSAPLAPTASMNAAWYPRDTNPEARSYFSQHLPSYSQA